MFHMKMLLQGNFVASKEECFLCFNVYAENVDVEIYLCVVYNFCQAEQCVYGNFVAEVGECFSGVEVRGCKSRREDGLSGLHAWDQGMLNVFNFYTLRTPTCN